MCSTRDRFVLNVSLTASKNHIRGKLDFYSETASHVSSGFFPLQTKGPPAYSKSGAVISNICWEWGRGTAVGGCHALPPSPAGAGRAAPAESPEQMGLQQQQRQQTCFHFFQTVSGPVICYPDNPSPCYRISSNGFPSFSQRV